VNEVELKRFALLAEFTEDDCLAIMQVLEPASLIAGRRLFREGGQSDGMALVVEGTVRLECRRTEQQLRVGAGTALGTLSLVGMGPRESTAVSETPCEILWLRRSEFRRLVDDAPRTACRLLEAIAGEFAGRVRRELDSIAS
jgi:CRP-like cAMP-binding protein